MMVYMQYDRLDKDVEMMKKAGINTVRIAESTWAPASRSQGVLIFPCGKSNGCHGRGRNQCRLSVRLPMLCLHGW